VIPNVDAAALPRSLEKEAAAIRRLEKTADLKGDRAGAVAACAAHSSRFSKPSEWPRGSA
jgi:hypothetical protein